MFFTKIFQTGKETGQVSKRTAIYRSFMRREAELGGTLFGPVAEGGRREFFCLDESTWVWHEEWLDDNRQKQVRNTRYDLRPTGVLKAQNGQGYQMVSLDEARHLESAIKTYISRVKKEIYHLA